MARPRLRLHVTPRASDPPTDPLKKENASEKKAPKKTETGKLNIEERMAELKKIICAKKSTDDAPRLTSQASNIVHPTKFPDTVATAGPPLVTLKFKNPFALAGKSKRLDSGGVSKNHRRSHGRSVREGIKKAGLENAEGAETDEIENHTGENGENLVSAEMEWNRTTVFDHSERVRSKESGAKPAIEGKAMEVEKVEKKGIRGTKVGHKRVGELMVLKFGRMTQRVQKKVEEKKKPLSRQQRKTLAKKAWKLKEMEMQADAVL